MAFVRIGPHVALRRDLLYCGYDVHAFVFAPSDSPELEMVFNDVWTTTTHLDLTRPMTVIKHTVPRFKCLLLYNLTQIVAILQELTLDLNVRDLTVADVPVYRHGSDVYISPTSLNEVLRSMDLPCDSHVSSILSFLCSQSQNRILMSKFGSLQRLSQTRSQIQSMDASAAGISTPDHNSDDSSISFMSMSGHVQQPGPVHPVAVGPPVPASYANASSVPSGDPPQPSASASTVSCTSAGSGSGDAPPAVPPVKKRIRASRAKPKPPPPTTDAAPVSVPIADPPPPVPIKTDEIRVAAAVAALSAMEAEMESTIAVDCDRDGASTECESDHDDRIGSGSGVAPSRQFRRIMHPFLVPNSMFGSGGDGMELLIRKFAAWCVYLRAEGLLDGNASTMLMFEYIKAISSNPPSSAMNQEPEPRPSSSGSSRKRKASASPADPTKNKSIKTG